jgi:hypothetical protein
MINRRIEGEIGSIETKLLKRGIIVVFTLPEKLGEEHSIFVRMQGIDEIWSRFICYRI